jgi:hypothetical protein
MMVPIADALLGAGNTEDQLTHTHMKRAYRKITGLRCGDGCGG